MNILSYVVIFFLLSFLNFCLLWNLFIMVFIKFMWDFIMLLFVVGDSFYKIII